MEQKIVTSQAELDAIPVDFDGRIIIKFGTPYNRAKVNRKFKYPVVLRGSSSAVLRDSSSAVLRDSSSAVLWGSSSAVLWGSSSAVLWGSSSAELWDSSSAVLRDSSRAVLRGSSSAELWDSSSAVLWDSSSAELWGNAQALDRSVSHNIETSGNARVVYDPRTIEEYIDSIGDLEQTEATVKLYKAVHKRGGRYFSDSDNDFEYVIGETATADGLTDDPEEDCGHGIHMADKSWCVGYGAEWSDLAILEVEAEKTGIVVPLYGAGKVRARSAKVIREVPLEECGILGKTLAARRG